MEKILLIFSEYFLLPIIFVAFPFVFKIIEKNKKVYGREFILEIVNELSYALIFCIVFFSLGVQTNVHAGEDINDFIISALISSLILLLVSIATSVIIRQTDIISNIKIKLKVS